MKHLIIVGIGGFPRELYAARNHFKGYGKVWDIKGFLDGDKKASPEEYDQLPLPVLGEIESYTIENDDVFYCAVGAPVARRKITEKLQARGASFISLIHDTALIYENVTLGEAIFVGENVLLTDNIVVGNHVSLLAGATVGHDCTIGDYTSIMGHVSILGRVSVGAGTYIGTGAILLPDSTVGDNAYVGAASLVLRKVKDNTKVFGIPAEVM